MMKTDITKTWIDKLKEKDACEESLLWASEYDSAQAAWSACERGDWMLWAWAQNCGGKIGSESHRRLVLCAVECAKTSVKYIKDENVKKLAAKKSLETTKRWARGEDGVTLKDVKEAAVGVAAVYAAADAAARAATHAAADAAADAAARAATRAAAARAATRAARAAYTGYAAAAAREKALKKCADIVRTIQPDCPKFKREKV